MNQRATRFRELSDADLVCVWGGVNRDNLLATLAEIERFFTDGQPTRVMARPAMKVQPDPGRPGSLR